MNQTLSVVVCSFNGAKRLGPCLDALAHQTVPVDVLVVDDGSEDGTDRLAHDFGFPVIRHESNRGISAARNTGLMHAVSSIVAYCDDDCTPPADWTENLLAAWKKNPDVTVLGGMIEVDHPISLTERYLEYRNPLVPAEFALANQPSFRYRFVRQFRPPRLPADDAFPVYSVVGANMSMNRERALAVGGFDEGLIFGEGEEVSLCVAVRKRFGDSSVVVDPHVLLAHRFDPSILKTWKRSFAYGRGAGERWRKNAGWPSLPVVGPTALLGTVAFAAVSWPLGLLIGLATLAAPWSIWISRTRARPRTSMIIFPFIALIDDLVCVAGFARGMSRESRGPSTFKRP